MSRLRSPIVVASLAMLVSLATGAIGCDDQVVDDASIAALPAPVLPPALLDYGAALPAHFTTPLVTSYDNTPADDATTDAGATLGRVLFYDRRLSANGAVACASCHQQDHGFSDPRPKSIGFEGGATDRHSMPVIDARFYQPGSFFWDERAATLEEQVLKPIQNPVEMGMTLPRLTARLEATAYYAPLFTAAFGDPEITSDRIARALAQFVRSIVGYRSRWDAAVAQVDSIEGDLPGFTAEENRGKEIFFGQHDPDTRGLCGTCHLRQNPLAFVPAPPGGAPAPQATNLAAFYVATALDIGLPDLEGVVDLGVGGITGVTTDDRTFKAPSLRNVALRPPYMHDGRFATLAEVVDYYDHGVTASANLDPALRAIGGGPLRLELTAADKQALIAFLGTLTDETLAVDERFSNPFPHE